MTGTREGRRIKQTAAGTAAWDHWGPYLSERAWGTVREDYSADGDAWDYFPHDHARSRAYRWNEDGLAGICDRHQHLCFALALWNGRDPILKERLFGLTGNEGNHGEDVKEYYFYLDTTPTHSLHEVRSTSIRRRPTPTRELVEENRRRGRSRARVRAARHRRLRRGSLLRRRRRVRQGRARGHADPASRVDQPRPRGGAARTCCPPSGSATPGRGTPRRGPAARSPPADAAAGPTIVARRTRLMGRTVALLPTARRSCSSPRTRPTSPRLFGTPNAAPYVKDAFHERCGPRPARRPSIPTQRGTKAAAHSPAASCPRAAARRVRLRLDRPAERPAMPLGADFDARLSQRAKPRPTSSTRRSSRPGSPPTPRNVHAPGASPGCSGEAVLPLRSSCAG